MRAVILDRATLGNVDLSRLLDNGDSWEVFEKTEPEDVDTRTLGADIVLTNKVELTDKNISTNPSLKLIMVMATGTNNIDLKAAKKRHISVCNVRAYGSASVAQHTLTLMLNLATQTPEYLSAVRRGEWQQRNEVSVIHRPIIELSGKRLGLVGLGELGRSVAHLAGAFGMNVMVAQRAGHSKPDRFDLKELLPQVDFLSLHCPLDEHNRHMINAKTLSLMPKSSFLINTARGGLVDSKALVNALENGELAGAATDTLETEPPTHEDPLLVAQKHLPNLLITPHNAWGAQESRQRLVDQLCDIITGYHQGNPINQL